MKSLKDVQQVKIFTCRLVAAAFVTVSPDHTFHRLMQRLSLLLPLLNTVDLPTLPIRGLTTASTASLLLCSAPGHLRETLEGNRLHPDKVMD